MYVHVHVAMMAYVQRFDVHLSDKSLNRCISHAMQALGYEKVTCEERESIKSLSYSAETYLFCYRQVLGRVCVMPRYHSSLIA